MSVCRHLVSLLCSKRLCDKIFIPSQGYEDLRQTVETLQSTLNISKVNQSLESVRLLASRPAALFDPSQLQDRPLIFGETIPTSRVQVPIQEAHLVAVDASGHSTSGPEPFLDAVLIAEELVILLEIAH